MQRPTSGRFRAVLGTVVVAGVLASTVSCNALRPKSSLEELATTQLTTETYPWFVVHGIVASGPELSLRDVHTGAGVNAVDYLTAQHELMDRNGQPVAIPYKEDGLPRFPRTDGQYVAEGHPNQFLAALIGAGVPLSHPVELADGHRYTLADVLENVKLHLKPAQILVVPPAANYEDHELGWSIAAIAEGLGTDAVWKNRWGEDVSLEGLVEIAVQRPIGWGSCAGTHELLGLVRALRAHRATHTDASGVWERLTHYLDDAKARARAAQHADGSFDYEWSVSQPRAAQPELGLNKKVHVTGHMLEWLAQASSPEEIEAPYLRKAYDFLERCRFTGVGLVPGQRGTHEVSYGALTHAVHGMSLYRERIAAHAVATG